MIERLSNNSRKQLWKIFKGGICTETWWKRICWTKKDQSWNHSTVVCGAILKLSTPRCIAVSWTCKTLFDVQNWYRQQLSSTKVTNFLKTFWEFIAFTKATDNKLYHLDILDTEIFTLLSRQNYFPNLFVFGLELYMTAIFYILRQWKAVVTLSLQIMFTVLQLLLL